MSPPHDDEWQTEFKHHRMRHERRRVVAPRGISALDNGSRINTIGGVCQPQPARSIRCGKPLFPAIPENMCSFLASSPLKQPRSSSRKLNFAIFIRGCKDTRGLAASFAATLTLGCSSRKLLEAFLSYPCLAAHGRQRRLREDDRRLVKSGRSYMLAKTQAT